MTTENDDRVQTLERLLKIAEDIMMIVKNERNNHFASTPSTSSASSSEIVSHPSTVASVGRLREENINRRWNPYQRNLRNSGISRTQHQECTSTQRAPTTRKNLNEMLLRITKSGNTCHLVAHPCATNTQSTSDGSSVGLRERVQVNNKTGSVKEKHMCAICLEQYLNNVPVVTVCGHVFCKTCIYATIRRTARCPLCNRFLNFATTFRIFL